MYSDGFGQIPRRRSLLARLKRERRPNLPLYHGKNMTVPRMTSNKLQRENSFHVLATTFKDKPRKFPWAKIEQNNSSEDRLSTISSMDDLDGMKCRRLPTEKQDFATQTDTEMLKSILRMPYLRRRNGKKIERTSAIDAELISLKESSVEPWCPRNMSSPKTHIRNGSKRTNTYSGSNGSKTAQERTMLLCPGYSDDSISVSDDFEHEDFEFYDSVSHLLQVHKPASMNSVPSKSPVCFHDEGMTNYLNPLRTEVSYPESEISVSNETIDSRSDKSTRRPPVQLIVENKPNGTMTSVITDPLRLTQNASSVSLKEFHNSNNTHCNYQKSLSNNCLACSHGADSDSRSSHTSTAYRRRASSPAATPLISCRFLPNSEKDLQSLSAFTRRNSYRDDSLPGTFTCSKNTDDITQGYIQTLDKEETSMLQFHNFMKERGVNLDMTFIESSDV